MSCDESLTELNQALILSGNFAQLVARKGCGQDSLYVTEHQYIQAGRPEGGGGRERGGS